jgi:hypothetical protein
VFDAFAGDKSGKKKGRCRQRPEVLGGNAQEGQPYGDANRHIAMHNLRRNAQKSRPKG